MNEMDIESESDDNTEVDLQDIEMINAVLLEADEPSSSQVSISQFSSTATASCSIPRISTACQDQTKIDEALALNRLIDDKYQRLEKLLKARLQECQSKLKQLANTDISYERDDRFRYHVCGRPYFRDKFNFTAPPNQDTILMEKTEMYDFSTLVCLHGWTVRDKTQFINVMLKMSQQIRVKELLSSIAKLKREGSKSGKDVDAEITSLSKQIIEVKKKQLHQVALPLDRSLEYDWETLANKLGNRHVTEEYRSFWKLFFHPSINKSPWTKSEHNKLQKIVFKYNNADWDQIATELNTGRSGYQCFVYFRTNMSTTADGKKWTNDEVEYLKRLIDYYKEDDFIPWGKVAASIENRTKIQVYNKYISLKVERKGRFLPEEDAVILNFYKIFGNDFKKMMAYLPGRSISQLRTRYNILSQNNISTMWTIEEDRKLLQLMSNEDSTTFYSNATKHFPGKLRSHVRSRYITLVNWMRKHPHADLAHAPRRGARRLTHGTSDDDLIKSIENLEKRMKNEVESKKPCRVTKESSDKDIEDAIVTIFVTELIQDQEHDNTVEQECNDILMEQGPSVATLSDDTNLKAILVLLNSQLNLNYFKTSPYSEKYPNLAGINKAEAEQTYSVVTLKSYSRKERVTTIIKKHPDIWGNSILGTLKRVLPPHYATITGAKALMSVIGPCSADSCNISHLMKRNNILKDQMTLLMERFNALFTWPMILSNIIPNSTNVFAPEPEAVVKKKHLKRINLNNASCVTIPPLKKRLMWKNKDHVPIGIDLEETDSLDETTIEQNFPV